MSMDQNIIERSTYSILEWLGDVGGLYDALIIIGHVFMGPLTAFTLQTSLMTNMFQYISSLRKEEKRDKQEAEAKGEVNKQRD